MANKNVSSSEQYTKKSNRFLLLAGVGILLILLMITCTLSNNGGYQNGGETPLDLTSDSDPLLQGQKGDFDHFGAGRGLLVASPAAVEMTGVVLGSKAETVVTLTANDSSIIFNGMELADPLQEGFVIENGTCEPNRPINQGSSCTIKVLWNPTDLRQIQNTLNISWREANPGIFSDSNLAISLKGQSTDSKDCVICESPCSDKEEEKKQIASLFTGESGKVNEDGTVEINGQIYKVQDGLIVDGNGDIVGIVEPEKIPLGLDNKVMGTISKTGTVLNANGEELGRILGDGTIVNSSLNVLGAAVPIVSVMDAQGKIIGKTVKDGTVIDASGAVIGRPMVDGSVVALDGAPLGYLRPYGLVINFIGDVVGGIIPDGSIVNGSKQVVGAVKPNGLATNPDGELIGSVVPTGVAVGAGCKSLGTVLPNGQIKDSFSQIIGKTLIDGSIVDEKGLDLGSVIRDGLIINIKGDIVGFVNSEGKAVDGKGSVIGCVNPDGSVSAGKKVVGAVMPKGFVVGRNCQVVGSVYPNGVVMNQAVEVVAQVRPDAYVVNVNDRIIGVVVPRGSAIADGCRMLGMITPDGQVVDTNGMNVGCLTPEKQIVNKQQEVIGFVATLGIVVDKNGKVIGRTRPDGKVIDLDGKVIGCVNEDGTVVALDGTTVIGQVLGSHPNPASEGVILDPNGDATGWSVIGKDVFDENGNKIGELVDDHLVVNPNGEIIGVIPPDGVIFSHDGLILGRYSRQTGTALTLAGERFGVVLSDNTVLNSDKTEIIGLLIADKTSFMDMNGQYMATMTIEGVLQGSAGEVLGVIKSDGTVINRAGQTVGVRIPKGSVYSVTGKEIGSVNSKGEVISTSKSVIGRVLGNGLAISNDGKVLGGVYPEISLPFGADGVLGSLTINLKVNDNRGRQIGTASPFGTVFGTKSNLSGRLLRIGPYVNANGQLVGWANFKGGLNDKTGAEIGRITLAGVALDENNNVIGTLVPHGVVVSGNGSYLASVSTNGLVLTADGQNTGLANGYRYVSNEKDGIVGQLLPAGIAVNADGGLLGWTRFDGAVEDGNGVIGRVTLDGKVIHSDGTILGTYLPLGSLALGTKSELLGVVDGSGKLVNARGEKVGTLTNDRYIFNDGVILGRLMQNTPAVNGLTNGRLIGMAGADGVTMVVNDNKPLGNVMTNGFVVDLTKKVIGGLAPVGLPIGTKLGMLGVSLSSGQAVSKGNVVASAVGGIMGGAYNAEGHFVGGILEPATFIDRNGAVIGRSSGTANVISKDGKKLATYMPFGSALTPDTIWAGGVMPLGTAINDDGYDIGVVALDGTISGKDGLLMGRILSDGSAVGLSDKTIFTTMPYVGHTVKQGLPFGYRNTVLGRTTVGGDVIDASDKKVYRMLDDGTVLGNEMPLDGAVLSFNPAIGHNGEGLGVLDGSGLMMSFAGEENGKIAVNGAVKGSHKYRILGALIPEQLVVNECKVVGQTSYNGQVINGQGNSMGRMTPDKWAVDTANNKIGRAVRVGLVASPEGGYLGRTLPDSTVVDLNGVNMGCARNDGSVVNGSGEVIGHVVERGLVLDKNGNPIGRVKHDGTVVDKGGKVVGKVLGDGKGTVVNPDGEVIGRVVSPDEELMFNKDGTIAGTFGRNGMFKDPEGNEQFQVLPDGRIIDPKTGRQIATLTDDDRLLDINGNEISDIRVVRDQDGNFIGLVDDNGNIINFDGEVIGTVGENGVIYDLNGNVMEGAVLAGVDLDVIAPNLDKSTPQAGGRRIILDGHVIDVTPNGSLVDKDGNIIGYMGEDGRPYSLDERLLSGKDESKLPPPVKKREVTPEQSAAMDGLLAERRNAMKSKIRSFSRLLPSARTLARARKKQDLDWGEPKVISSYPVDMSRMILSDKAIPAVLVHSYDSENSSVPVTAIVERHIYAEQGRRIIIPAGSRLIGTASGGGSSERVAKVDFTWTRLIRPDGSAFKFDATSGDAQGRGGVAAYLDEQLLKKYGRPILESTLTSAIAFVTATNDDITTKDNGDKVLSARAEAANDARSNFIDSMSQIFTQLLEESMRIKPVLFVPAGTRMTIFANTDLWLRSEIEDELDYEAQFGADSKKAKGTSKGNWVAGRSGEMAEHAGTYGMEVASGSNEMMANEEAYYDPMYEDAGMGGGTIYDGAEDLMEEDENFDEEEEASEDSSPKKASKTQMSEPIFPRETSQSSRRLF